MYLSISISSILVSMVFSAALAAPIAQDSAVDFPGIFTSVPTLVATPVKRQSDGSAGTEPDNGDLDDTINQIVTAFNGINIGRAVVARQGATVTVAEPVGPTAEPSEGGTVIGTEATPSQTAVVGRAKVRARQDEAGAGTDEGAGSGEDTIDLPVPTLPAPEPVPSDDSGNDASQGGAAENIKKRIVGARQASVVSSVFPTESQIVSDTAATTETVAVTETSETVSVSDTAVAPSATTIIN